MFKSKGVTLQTEIKEEYYNISEDRLKRFADYAQKCNEELLANTEVLERFENMRGLTSV